MKGLRWILLGTLVAVLAGGCGGSTDTGGSTDDAGSARTAESPRAAARLPPEIKVTLNGYMGPETIGLLMADRRGYFDDAGLNIWLGAPVAPTNTVEYVANGVTELGVAQLPEVVLARDEGLPVKAVGSVIPRPTAAMIWLEGSGIRTMADLEGRTVGFPGLSYQEDLLRSVLEDAGLTPGDVKVKQLGYLMVPALLSGRVDAIFGGSWNLEGAALEARGAEPVVERVERFEVPAYDELVVISRSGRVAADPRMFRAFMSAVERGTVAAQNDPEAAAEVLGESVEANPRLTRNQLEAQLDATLPLLSKSGYMDPDRAAGLIDWMYGQGWIEEKMQVSELLTNQYLRQR